MKGTFSLKSQRTQSLIVVNEIVNVLHINVLVFKRIKYY